MKIGKCNYCGAKDIEVVLQKIKFREMLPIKITQEAEIELNQKIIGTGIPVTDSAFNALRNTLQIRNLQDIEKELFLCEYCSIILNAYPTSELDVNTKKQCLMANIMEKKIIRIVIIGRTKVICKKCVHFGLGYPNSKTGIRFPVCKKDWIIVDVNLESPCKDYEKDKN